LERPPKSLWCRTYSYSNTFFPKLQDPSNIFNGKIPRDIFCAQKENAQTKDSRCKRLPFEKGDFLMALRAPQKPPAMAILFS
jgi:hypothetical protein